MNTPCKHFGECGGCRSQDVAYAGQVARKSRVLGELFAPFWNKSIPVEPSPVQWHYRNKVDLAFGRKFYPEPPPPGFVRESILGYKAKGRWFSPLDIDECLIGPQGLSALLSAVRQWMRDQDLAAYDSRTKQGRLKILLVREGARTGDSSAPVPRARQRMVVLITGDGEFDKASFVETVQGAFPAHSIYRGIYRGTADVATADELELLAGAPSINERLIIPDEPARELLFRISPLSFFQTNTLATEILYGLIREWAYRTAPEVLFDLYGGAGGIALTCADLCGRVYSVEDVPSASQDGIFNAEANGVRNVTFTTEKVEDYLKRPLPADIEQSAAVVDPPRSGLHPKVLRRLVDIRFPELLYISCKPAVLKTEMPALLEAYSLAGMRAVDLFPHTEHVELIAAFVGRR